jgi:hypothetical protein
MVKEVNSWVIYLIHCKNLYKYHSVAPPIPIIKEEKKIFDSFLKYFLQGERLSCSFRLLCR